MNKFGVLNVTADYLHKQLQLVSILNLSSSFNENGHVKIEMIIYPANEKSWEEVLLLSREEK